MLSPFMIAYADGQAAAQAVGQEMTTAGMVTSLLPFVVMIAICYFFLIRPQKKKEKELKNMLASLKVSDEVATIGGIHGKIVRIKDDLFVLESGIGTTKSYITVDRNAVSRFIKRGEEKPEPTPIPGVDMNDTEEE